MFKIADGIWSTQHKSVVSVQSPQATTFPVMQSKNSHVYTGAPTKTPPLLAPTHPPVFPVADNKHRRTPLPAKPAPVVHPGPVQARQPSSLVHGSLPAKTPSYVAKPLSAGIKPSPYKAVLNPLSKPVQAQVRPSRPITNLPGKVSAPAVYRPVPPAPAPKQTAFPHAAVQMAKKKFKGKVMDLEPARLAAAEPAKQPQGPLFAAIVARNVNQPMAPPLPPVKPVAFDGTCTPRDWNNNARIIALVASPAKPAKFWASSLKDLGVSADDATQYWSFDALWVKSGNMAGTNLQHGEYVDGELRLHFHPHAKLSENYLHIKKSDGSDPGAGEFTKDHWLVTAIGLTALDVTPDGGP